VAEKMRTGSIGNRDAETLITTLVEEKRRMLSPIRDALLHLGYNEEAGYDAINIESFVAFSIQSMTRFILKHKWEVTVTAVLMGVEEEIILSDFPELVMKEKERNSEDGTEWMILYPASESDLIIKLATYFAGQQKT
jgi:hypothetical protein